MPHKETDKIALLRKHRDEFISDYHRNGRKPTMLKWGIKEGSWYRVATEFGLVSQAAKTAGVPAKAPSCTGTPGSARCEQCDVKIRFDGYRLCVKDMFEEPPPVHP